jgi:hypothetical protein
MTRLMIVAAAMAAALMTATSTASAQSHGRPHLHVSDRWDDCAFQLDAALTQAAWRQFTKEAALVTYFRPLRDAAPMGRGRFEISVLQSVVGIDDHDAAWNDTFVHPDSTHWLYDGSGLPVPGLMARAGVTDRLDFGVYYTQNPNANYGFAGAQVQYNVLQQATSLLDAAARIGAVMLFGPDDLDHSVVALDLIASRRYPLFGRVAIAPYAGVSTFLSSSHEKSAVVELVDERVAGVHAMAGAVAQYSFLRVAVEYDAAAVRSRSVRIGFAF